MRNHDFICELLQEALSCLDGVTPASQDLPTAKMDIAKALELIEEN